jgi:hypothetical protein
MSACAQHGVHQRAICQYLPLIRQDISMLCDAGIIAIPGPRTVVPNDLGALEICSGEGQ